MEINSLPIFSLTLDFFDIFFQRMTQFENSIKQIESILFKEPFQFESGNFEILKSQTNEFSVAYQNLRKISLSYLDKSKNPLKKKDSIPKINQRYEKENKEVEGMFSNIENKKNSNTSSLNKIKENFEINTLNRSNSNKLGFRLKEKPASNKHEEPLLAKKKTKQISLDKSNNKSSDTTMIENNNNNQMGYRCSLDLESRNIKNSISVIKEECDPRFLDIITYNGKITKEESKLKEENISINDNATENMIDVESTNKLSAREEKAIITETLKKDYKCEFDQLTNYKSIPN